MKLYNTLTRQKEEFVPITPGEVKMYSCGPTVYNYFHVGNARPFIIFDLLRRYFEYRGYKVEFVQNFTDIDDKVINKANEEGVDFNTIAERYIKEYFVDAQGLGVKKATVHPRATETMDAIIDIVERLIENGHAYVAENGDVYFRTKSFPEYGKLCHQPMEELQAGARISVGEVKEDPMDFAVWKAAKPGEPAWDTPWGSKGRPGWHIECSAMANKYLGKTIDIHSGGLDLIFPHHENEIAQSECANGCTFAHYWLHNGFLTIDNEKMSKSKGEFLTVSLLEDKGYDPMAYRFFCLQSHYRKSLVFTWENLDNAALAYSKLIARIATLKPVPGAALDASAASALRRSFTDALDNDLNTSLAVTAVYDVLKAKTDDSTKQALIEEFDSVLALGLAEHARALRERTAAENAVPAPSQSPAGQSPSVSPDDPFTAEILSLIEARRVAKQQKNFAEADRIRAYLSDRGVTLVDTKDGTTFRKN